MSKKRLAAIGPILIIIALGIIVYYNSLFNSFVWDDEHLIINNQLIRSYKYILTAFTTANTQGAGEFGNMYRPLTTLTYIFDYAIWQLNPFGYHLVNILVHIINGCLVFLLISTVSKNRNTGLLVGGLFIVCAVISGVVNFVSARADLLSAMFFLACLLCFIKYRDRSLKIYYIGSIVFFIFSLLSKEIGLIAPAAIIFYDFAFSFKASPRTKSAYLKDYIPYGIVILFYIAVRILLLKFAAVNLVLDTGIPEIGVYRRMLISYKAILFYLRLLIFPFGLRVVRIPTVPWSVFDSTVFYAFQGLMLIAIFAFFLYRKSRLGFFGIGWFFLTLSPYLNIFPINALIGEGWVYIPSIGLWLLFALGFNRLINISSFAVQRLLYIGLILFLSMNICITVRRNLDWRSPLTLYSQEIKKSPNSTLLHNNLGAEYFYQGRYKEAGQEFITALKLSSDYPVAHNNLAKILEHKGLFDQAIEEYKKSIKFSHHFIGYANLGFLYIRLGDLDLAVETFKTAKDLVPYLPQAHFYLGWTYYLQGKKRQAEEEIRQAIKIDKTYIEKVKQFRIRTTNKSIQQ